MIKLCIIIAGTIVITAISKRSLANPRSHGFYRFFAFESILFLTVLNSKFWNQDPLSVWQIVSFILLILSLFLALPGFYLLWKIGRPYRAQTDSMNLGFENTSNLVTVGVYRFIRHPLYASLIFLTLGVWLKRISLVSSYLMIFATIFLFFTAKAEERENLAHFGESYKQYMSRTRMFVPFIF